MMLKYYYGVPCNYFSSLFRFQMQPEWLPWEDTFEIWPSFIVLCGYWNFPHACAGWCLLSETPHVLVDEVSCKILHRINCFSCDQPIAKYSSRCSGPTSNIPLHHQSCHQGKDTCWIPVAPCESQIRPTTSLRKFHDSGWRLYKMGLRPSKW